MVATGTARANASATSFHATCRSPPPHVGKSGFGLSDLIRPYKVIINLPACYLRRAVFASRTLACHNIFMRYLQPFAERMAAARIFVELGNPSKFPRLWSWSTAGTFLTRFGTQKLYRYIPRCCSYNMTPISSR